MRDAVCAGVMTPHLQGFLEQNFGDKSKTGKADKSKVRLGVAEVKLATAISEGVGIKCDNSEMTQELLR